MINGTECWVRYYTPKKLAEALVNLLPPESYISAVDICCGSFNLLEAASKAFPGIKLIGADINSYNSIPDGVSFYNIDGRVFADTCEEKFDLILSNPPFGVFDDSSQCVGSRIEYDMLSSNVSLMHEGSFLLAIMPSTLVEGISYSRLRRTISERLRICDIVSLPDDSFDGGIRTYCIIASLGVSNEGPTRFSSMIEMDGRMVLVDSRYVGSSSIRSGDWISRGTQHKSTVTILRGRLKSSDLRSDRGKMRALHCSSCDGDVWQPKKLFTNMVSSGPKCVKGDILINRIGKNAGRWCVYDGEDAIISDCLLLIKDPSESIIRIFSANSSKSFLRLRIYGLTTRYITQTDIHDMIEKGMTDGTSRHDGPR